MQKEILQKSHPSTELYSYTPDSWAPIADSIGRIDLHAFSDSELDTVETVRDGFSRFNFKKFELITVLLISESGAVIGYSQAEQSWTQVSARIVRTALAPEFQKQGLVGTLMDRMEAELKLRGVTTFTQKVRIKNGYADAVRRHYGDRIVADYSDGIRASEEQCFSIKI